MKILYGIQGTGHGHISRAREILPLLADKADVDVLISGYNCHMNLDGVKVTHKRGISLAYDSNGSISYLKTALSIKPVTFLQDVHSLNVKSYDLVVSDYEPVTAWASAGSRVPTIALSHQASFLSNRTPRPKHRSLLAEKILKNFAPCNHSVSFHFLRYDSFVLPPVIRQDVQNLEPVNGNHITVYLPAFSPETLMKMFRMIPGIEWQVFSPDCTELFKENNVTINPVGNFSFLNSLRSCKGVLTSAGFETCAEAMFLGKKLLVIPIGHQYEQLCNAAALNKMGIQSVKKIDSSFKNLAENWIKNSNVVCLPEIADTERLTQKITRYSRKLSKKRLTK